MSYKESPIYKKGNRLFWIGFLAAIFFGILSTFGNLPVADYPSFSGLTPWVPVFDSMKIFFVVVIVYACFLVLKSKNRSEWNLLWLLLNLIGVVIIYALKEPPQPGTISEPLPPTQLPTTPV